MAYYKALTLTFNDRHDENLLEQSGMLTLTAIPGPMLIMFFAFQEGRRQRRFLSYSALRLLLPTMASFLKLNILFESILNFFFSKPYFTRFKNF